MMFCPCGSMVDYSNCCGLYIGGAAIAESPEILMRSRYTAYTLANVSYIKRTMRGKALIGFNAGEAKRWARRVSWTGLQIVNAFNEHADKGFVEFIARFQDGDHMQSIHEISEFHRVQGVWFYVDGTYRQ